MERVSVVHGKSPVILVAPHGYDDTYTDILAERAAEQCSGNAVINKGWQRHPTVDVLNDKANCNQIDHASHNVVKDEFFDPISKMEARLLAKHPKVYVFHIHGCGNDIRTKTGKNLGLVIGYGKGETGKSRPTCNTAIRDKFTYILEADKMWLPAVAAAGSRFGGWDRNNLLQMWQTSLGVTQAMQLEFVTALRRSKKDAEASGTYLGSVIHKFLTLPLTVPQGYSCPSIKI